MNTDETVTHKKIGVLHMKPRRGAHRSPSALHKAFLDVAKEMETIAFYAFRELFVFSSRKEQVKAKLLTLLGFAGFIAHLYYALENPQNTHLLLLLVADIMFIYKSWNLALVADNFSLVDAATSSAYMSSILLSLIICASFQGSVAAHLHAKCTAHSDIIRASMLCSGTMDPSQPRISCTENNYMNGVCPFGSAKSNRTFRTLTAIQATVTILAHLCLAYWAKKYHELAKNMTLINGHVIAMYINESHESMSKAANSPGSDDEDTSPKAIAPPNPSSRARRRPAKTVDS